ncbi:hypothetical protein JYB64_25685, partial [Algoriphagus aestuarii]|nr:hypothetical protein [Algoriphagus aestuarii]
MGRTPANIKGINNVKRLCHGRTLLINKAIRKGNSHEQQYINKVKVLLNFDFNWMENELTFSSMRIVYSLKKRFALLEWNITSLLKKGSIPL